LVGIVGYTKFKVSSSVARARALSEESLSKVQAFTFGTKNCDEIKVAKAVTSKSGLKLHHIIEYEPNSLVDYAKNVVYLTDGMDVVSVSFLPYAITRVQKYINIYFHGFALDTLLGSHLLNAEIMRAKDLNDLVNALDKVYTLFSRAELRLLLDKRLWPYVKNVEKYFIDMVNNAKGKLLPNKADYFNLNTRQRRYTLMGAVIGRNFLEDAIPACDNLMIEKIREIPPQWRYKHRIHKKLLKRLSPRLAAIPYQATMVRADTPELFWRMGTLIIGAINRLKSLLWKLSRGRIYLPNRHTYFDFNEVLRVSSDWRKLVATTLMNHESLCYKFNYLNKGFVEKIVREHYNCKKNNGEKIAFLMTFELFLRIFLRDSR